MAEKNKIRWGILGPGNIARHAVAPAIRYSENGILQCIASRSGARAAAIALETGAESSAGSYEKLLGRDDIDAIYIGLPNGLHEEWAIKAAEAGKHVLCEKSLTLTVDAAERVVAACARHKVLLMEAFMYRHHPQWYHVRDRLYQGRVGEIRLIHGQLCGTLTNRADHRWTPELGGGALFDVTCYPINAARYLTGQEPVGIRAQGKFLEPGVDESTVVTMEFPGGVLATAQGSLAATASQGLRVIGTEGEIVVDKPFVPGFESTSIRIITGTQVEELVIGGANQFLHQVEHFARCIQSGENLRYPAENGLNNVRALVAALDSAQQD